MTKLLLSYTEKKRPRVNFGQHTEKLKIPNLLNIQMESYENFIQNKVKNIVNRKDIGLESVFKSVFPIYSNNKNIKLEYISYSIGKSLYNTSECKTKGITYAGPLKIKVRLNVNNKTKKDIDQAKAMLQEIYILDMPLMTNKSTFIINGTERVIVSQLHRSPGLFFEIDKNKSNSSEKSSYIAKIIPQRGAWLDIEFDSKNCLFARIDKKRKFPVSTILRALDLNNEQILEFFLKKNAIKIENNNLYIETSPENMKGELVHDYIYSNNNEIILEKGTYITEEHVKKLKNNNINKFPISKEYTLGKTIANDILDNNNSRIIIHSNTKISNDIINLLINKEINSINIVYSNDTNYSQYMLNTFKIDLTKSQLDALIEIYKTLRPGELPTKDSAKQLFENLFFSEEKYDLSLVGRMKFNKRVNKIDNVQRKTLSKEDIIDVIKKIIDIKNGKDHIDDIDHLGNRRVRSVGEIIENQFKSGFLRIERSIKEKLSLAEYENLTPQDIINAKPIATMIREFFCSSQLSQFMDQNNPLSEITHKRRISALGPGGLTRDRAGFEVRDVHITHYGRVCPIETPEGPNIGLINSLAIYARTNEYGFLETPYIKIENKKVTKTIIYLSAIDESDYI
ncbi:MAG: DNA-directed RNA polymerase subunit beta, partial [Enterobacteriaceae bacterium]|nr:DNA-directed RNA polymerase subunit beta [Enterobacteriaceae bacterium]